MTLCFRVDPNDPQVIQWKEIGESEHFWTFFCASETSGAATRVLLVLEGEELRHFANRLAERTPLSADTIVTALLDMAQRRQFSLSETLELGETYIMQRLAEGSIW